MLKTIEAGDLEIAYFDHGTPGDPVVLLMHGFPYDIHAYDDVVSRLTNRGLRVVVPYLRGYGATRFLESATLRSGEQAVLGNDLRVLMDALNIDTALVGGYDWGGRAACVVSAVWPERVTGLVTCGGYNIQNIARAMEPVAAQLEHRYWYQYYFHSERGRLGLERNRDDICRLLWSLWSPNWKFDDDCFQSTAQSFHNPDFVDVVIHSYRHRYALVDGDASVLDIEKQLSVQPLISVPTIVMYGAANGVTPTDDYDVHDRQFTNRLKNVVLPGIGHNIPQEAPDAFADAVLQLAAS